MKLKDRIDEKEAWWDAQLESLKGSDHTARWVVGGLAILAVLVLILWARGCSV